MENEMTALRDFAAGVKAGRTNSPQTVRTPGRTDEVENNAGGFVFKVSEKDRLERFLILGTDGGTYYVDQPDLTKQNVTFVKELIRSNERLVLDTLVDVSENGRAFRNGPALFTLALLFVEGKDKAAARAALPRVARTSTHLFEFAQYVDDLGGWGRAKRTAVAGWYQSKDVNSLAYQAVKYRNRNGWSHRDLFRLSHPVGVNKAVGNFILGRTDEDSGVYAIDGFRLMQQAQSVKSVIETLDLYKNLPWETIPTGFLKSPEVWKKLFYNGQLRGQALVRNITRLARIDAFSDVQFAADYAARLTDAEMIEKTRLHPINYLNALVVHEDGQVDRRNNRNRWYFCERNRDWAPVAQIVDALNEGFHLAFKSLEPAGKRTYLALDVSGSMSAPAIGLDLSCSQVSAAVAMTIARTEPAYVIRGFSTSLIDLGISAKSSLADSMRKVSGRTFGGTDVAQPMLEAARDGVEIDTFVVLTDNETWAGSVKPFQALKQYRDKTGIPARLAVLGVASTECTVADPSDKGMMDFVGFDSAAPKALADFSAGRL
jgi:60 kDa SS-A/Ro ribonucleoprotein